jgi:hypothetical protein
MPRSTQQTEEATMTGDQRDKRNHVVTAATSNTSDQPASVEPAPRAVEVALGAAGGAVAGAAVGTVTLGPIGAIVGALAGTIGGGWTALAAAAPTHYGPEHDREYRAHYEADSERLADRPYERARPAYQLGHLAARNPDYASRDFESVERDLRRVWSDDVRRDYGDWQVARRYAHEAFVRERASSQGRARVELNLGGSDTHQRPSFSDPIPPGDPDRVAGDRQVPGRAADEAP